MKAIALTLPLVLLLPLSGAAFYSSNVPTRCAGIPKNMITRKATVSSQDEKGSDECRATDEFSSLRRALLAQVFGLSASAFLEPSVAWADATTDIGTSPERPVAILGAGGGTGMEVARALAKEGLYGVTMTRTGKDPFQVVKLKPELQSYIQHYQDCVNVVEKESLSEALANVNASAVIFCATASKQGGNAFEVDSDGVGNAAEAARDLKARFILVSALAVDRPNSKSYQITNTLGGNLEGIMDAKFQGENKVRSILKDYVIIRPGVLMNGKTKNGPLDMQVNQGDTIGGGMSRDELAGVVVGALISGKQGVTVEVYRRSTATPLQPAFTIPSGREATADSYVGLFDSTEPDWDQ